jgi:hypothetical protein
VEQPDILRYGVNTLERLQIPYLVVGSFASSIWGEPRLTMDIDIVIDLRADQIVPLCQAFPAPEFYVSETAVREAVTRRRQFNVLHPTSANKIDFMIPRDEAWSRMQLTRGRLRKYDGDIDLQVCSPEDVIIAKMRFYKEGESPKHLRDIAGVLDMQGESLDREYIARWVQPMQLQEIWQKILDKEKIVKMG